MNSPFLSARSSSATGLFRSRFRQQDRERKQRHRQNAGEEKSERLQILVIGRENRAAHRSIDRQAIKRGCARNWTAGCSYRVRGPTSLTNAAVLHHHARMNRHQSAARRRARHKEIGRNDRRKNIFAGERRTLHANEFVGLADPDEFKNGIGARRDGLGCKDDAFVGCRCQDRCTACGRRARGSKIP